MRYRSQTWQGIVERNRFAMETKLIISGAEYTDISAPIIERSTGSTPLEIGNVISASLRVNVMAPGQFAPGAPVTVMARIYDTQATSEWKKFGVYYIDQQPYNPYTRIVEITAYDALKRAEQLYDTSDDSPYFWPAKFVEVVEDAAEILGVGIDPRVRIPEGLEYYVQDPAAKGRSILDVLSGIAVCLGGNWVMTEEGLLRLVPLVGVQAENYRIIDAAGNSIVDGDADELVWEYATAAEPRDVDITTTVRPGSRPVSPVPIGGTDAEMGGTDTTVWVPVVLDRLTTSGIFCAGRVALETDEYASGDGIYSGEEINPGSSAPPDVTSSWVIRGVIPDTAWVLRIQNTLNTVYAGIQFCPFDAGGCVCDPCAELGDQVLIGTIRSVLVSIRQTLGAAYRCDLGSPASDELTAQYPYTGSLDRRPLSTYKTIAPAAPE